MSMPSPAAGDVVAPSTTPDAVDTRLRGPWLALTRLIAVSAAAFGIGSFVVRLPGHFAALQGVCTDTVCPYGQLSPDAARSFEALGISLVTYAVLRTGLTVAVALIWYALAGVLMWRRSDDWMALLVAVWLVFEGTATITGALSLGYAHTPQSHQITAQLVNFSTRFGFYLVFALFPTGRFVPGWTFWLVLAFAAEELPYEFFGYVPISGTPAALIWLGTLAALALTQIYRYRRVSSPVERQQTKWAIFGISVFIALAGVLLVPYLLDARLGQTGSFYNAIHTTVLIAVGALTPLAIALAILRYRLWEIDVIIRRTLIYGTLTAILAAVYFGAVLGAQAVVQALTGQRGQQPVAIVASTLLIFALFNPLRHRLQAGIDRRFYRQKYDAARTLAAFGATLRTETDLNELSTHLVAVVRETMQPAHISLWVRPPERRKEGLG